MKAASIATALLLVAPMFAGCRMPAPVPPADLRASGWRVREGQAVWTPARGRAGVAGEVLLATRNLDECFVQFAKPPFTLATAQAVAGAWWMEQAASRRQWRGRGAGPAHLVWFALAESMRGRPARHDWHFEARAGSAWCLTNATTGEGLEGYFAP